MHNQNQEEKIIIWTFSKTSEYAMFETEKNSRLSYRWKTTSRATPFKM